MPQPIGAEATASFQTKKIISVWALTRDRPERKGAGQVLLDE